jgi:hypothetical protein
MCAILHEFEKRKQDSGQKKPPSVSSQRRSYDWRRFTMMCLPSSNLLDRPEAAEKRHVVYNVQTQARKRGPARDKAAGAPTKGIAVPAFRHDPARPPTAALSCLCRADLLSMPLILPK